MKAESVWKQNVADHPHTHPRPVVYTILRDGQLVRGQLKHLFYHE